VTVDVTPEGAGWAFSGLRVLELGPGESRRFATGADEVVVLPLQGACAVEGDGEKFELSGRDGVFSAVTDFAYLPRDADAVVTAAEGGRFALASARARHRLPARYGAAEGVEVELRGAGRASRQVNNFCTPDTFEADRLIAVEVLTPGGNWSSYPPHKHDEHRDGEEVLEEIYYFEIADQGDTAGVGYQRVYASGPDRQIDVCTEVHTGDVVLIPFGYHGPSMAAPGYDMYYLNVMAGPAEERAWRFCDDPAHAWIRGTWADQPVDPRLPMTTSRRTA
jgi:5-deoxy-glucuronate isomerase